MPISVDGLGDLGEAFRGLFGRQVPWQLYGRESLGDLCADPGERVEGVPAPDSDDD